MPSAKKRKELLNKQLFDASYYGDKTLAEVSDLIGRGADVNAYPKFNSTALSCAAHRGDVKLCRLLLDNCAKLDASCGDVNSTPLMFAARVDKVEVCQLLIERGSDILRQNKHGLSALHQASQFGRLEVCHLLLQHGADPTAKDMDGETAVDAAKAGGFKEIAELLEKGVQPKAVVDSVEADSKKRKRQDDSDKNDEIIHGLIERAVSAEGKLEIEMKGRERVEKELRVALDRCAKAERVAAVSAASRQEVEMKDRESIDRLEKELGVMLERCKKAERDAAVPVGLLKEEQEKFKEAIEGEQTATQRAALAQGKLDGLEKELRVVLERCAKAELDAAVSAAVRHEDSGRTDRLEKEIRVAERDAAVSVALRQEDEKRFKEAIQRQQAATQEAICRAVAAEKVVSELRERAASAEGKLSHVLSGNYVVKDESLSR